MWPLRVLIISVILRPSQLARTARDCMVYHNDAGVTSSQFEEGFSMGFRLLPTVDKRLWNATAKITSLATTRSCDIEFNYNTSKNSYNIFVNTMCDGKLVKYEKWYTDDVIHKDEWTKLFYSISAGMNTRELYVSAQAHRGPEEFGVVANYLSGPFNFKWYTRSQIEFYLNCPNYCPIEDTEIEMTEKKTFYIKRGEHFTKVKVNCDILGMGMIEVGLGKDIIPDDGMWHQVLLTEGLRKLQVWIDGEIVKDYPTISKKPEIKKMGALLVGGGLLTWCDRSAFIKPIDNSGVCTPEVLSHESKGAKSFSGATISSVIFGILAALLLLVLLHSCHQLRRLKRKGKMEMVKNANINNTSQPIHGDAECNNQASYSPGYSPGYRQVRTYGDAGDANNQEAYISGYKQMHRNSWIHNGIEEEPDMIKDKTKKFTYSSPTEEQQQNFNLSSPVREYISSDHYEYKERVKDCKVWGKN